jgi:hypothetical protein
VQESHHATELVRLRAWFLLLFLTQEHAEVEHVAPSDSIQRFVSNCLDEIGDRSPVGGGVFFLRVARISTRYSSATRWSVRFDLRSATGIRSPFSSAIAARLNPSSVALVANHLHGPAVINMKGPWVAE